MKISKNLANSTKHQIKFAPENGAKKPSTASARRPRLRLASQQAAAVLAATAALWGVSLGSAQAAEGQLRIAQQYGIVYLLLHVAQDQQLIEKHGKAHEAAKKD